MSKKRARLTRAELKAYEARRAAERARISASTAEEPELLGTEVLQHSYSMTRDDEFRVIKSDLIRLLWIVAVLLVALAVATVFLG